MAAEDYLPKGAPTFPRYDDHPISLRAECKSLRARLAAVRVLEAKWRHRVTTMKTYKVRVERDERALLARADELTAALGTESTPPDNP